MANRPITTLFLLSSIDGKISTGASDSLDFDKDLPRIRGVREGLHQYYDIEKTTDIFSLNSGRVQAKMGANTKKGPVMKIPVHFVIIDNKPHLTTSGIKYFLKRGRKLFLVTTNKHHPAYTVKDNNLVIFQYPKQIDFKHLFVLLYKKYGAKRVTIQTGGTLNTILLRKGLIDHVSIVVAPLLVGGKDTSSIMDGESLRSVKGLKYIRALKLKRCEMLKDSYVHLFYDVMN